MNLKTISDPETIADLPPIHPGEILREEFIEPLELSAGKVAKACHVPRTRIERIVREEIGVTPDTALRLARYLGTTVDFWINLQAHYDAEVAKRIGAEVVAGIVPLERSAA
ncbi:HigA family addiction module antitoxin [Hansschlegelia zhihuaiae]|uniref:Addiction module antidote protein, HigA family n=1 Tax=Hansschlegelia zhihuaiae TaxID=405005 RepID=A0A4Q0M8V4_9HYPH|nr:HigA family addiction module antitoxin [Hansschlegelia zhihuaiae]RXF69611.1 addiction module antidote protein, HigA family [Hansschlegelia zhihuaiae]